jgi:hypothetical protein
MLDETCCSKHTAVGSGVRGQAALQKKDGKSFLYISGKQGIWRQEIAPTGPAGTGNVKLVAQTTHSPWGKPYDSDQFGYGLMYRGDIDGT